MEFRPVRKHPKYRSSIDSRMSYTPDCGGMLWNDTQSSEQCQEASLHLLFRLWGHTDARWDNIGLFMMSPSDTGILSTHINSIRLLNKWAISFCLFQLLPFWTFALMATAVNLDLLSLSLYCRSHHTWTIEGSKSRVQPVYKCRLERKLQKEPRIHRREHRNIAVLDHANGSF